MKIESLDNKQIKLFGQLKQKKYRARMRKFVVEGVHLVALALDNDEADYLFLTEQYDVRDEGKIYKGDVFVADVSCPYVYISDNVATKLADTVTSQGIFTICSMRDMSYDGTSVLLFDGVQDPGNVGTMMRTANAFGVHNFYFTTDAIDPYNDKVIRASQGAIFFSHLFFEDEDKTFVTKLNDLGYVYALDIVGKDLRSVDRPQAAFALIVGNEARGIAYDRWGGLSLTKITIPMQAHIESLNVAVATSIALYELQE